jgi:hypothetical protein
MNTNEGELGVVAGFAAPGFRHGAGGMVRGVRGGGVPRAPGFRPEFPGFYHWDLAGNVMPKLELLQKFGFYLRPEIAAEAKDVN